jgi:hypothetical protein
MNEAPAGGRHRRGAAGGGEMARCAEGRHRVPGEGRRRLPRSDAGGVEGGLRGLLGLERRALGRRQQGHRCRVHRPR